MSFILKSKEPHCLSELNAVPTNTYDDLKGDCQKETRALLHLDQKGLCAYCQRKFISNVFIEHWIPQSASPELQLKYSNYLGVCSGKLYINENEGTFNEFCSVSKGSRTITFNPLDESHFETLSYNEANQIASSSSKIDSDLNDLLNLNFNILCKLRQDSFERYLKNILQVARSMKLEKLEVLQKAKADQSKDPNEFVHYTVYRLNQLIDLHSS